MQPSLYLGPKNNPSNIATQQCIAEAISGLDKDSQFCGSSLPEPDEGFDSAFIDYCDIYILCDIGWVKFDAGVNTQSLCFEGSEFPTSDTSALFAFINGNGSAPCGNYKKSNTYGWIKF